jgi:hypothetical protein
MERDGARHLFCQGEIASSMMEFFGIFFFLFLFQPYTKSRRGTARRNMQRHGENEHKNTVEGDGIHP